MLRQKRERSNGKAGQQGSNKADTPTPEPLVLALSPNGRATLAEALKMADSYKRLSDQSETAALQADHDAYLDLDRALDNINDSFRALLNRLGDELEGMDEPSGPSEPVEIADAPAEQSFQGPAYDVVAAVGWLVKANADPQSEVGKAFAATRLDDPTLEVIEAAARAWELLPLEERQRICNGWTPANARTHGSPDPYCAWHPLLTLADAGQHGLYWTRSNELTADDAAPVAIRIRQGATQAQVVEQLEEMLNFISRPEAWRAMTTAPLDGVEQVATGFSSEVQAQPAAA